MNKGVAEQVGTPLEVYRNPATTFVAGFIGSPPMNFLSGCGESAMIDPGVIRQVASDVSPSPAIQTGIRPEHLRCCAPGTGLCDAEVAFFEELGAETLVYLRSPQGGEIYSPPGERGAPARPGDKGWPDRRPPAPFFL